MRRQWWTGILAVAVVAVPLPAPATPPRAMPDPGTTGAPTLQAWVVDGMTQLSRTAPAGTDTTAELSAARGETEPFQIAVRAADDQPLTGGDLTVSPLTGPDGADISSAAITRYREHFVKVRRHSSYGGGDMIKRRWFADALLPFVDPTTGEPPDPTARHAAVPYEVAPGRTQPFWVDIAVPRDAQPGTYEGTWTVTTDQGNVTGTISLEVRSFTLPVAPVAASSFGVYRQPNLPATWRLLLRYGAQPTAIPPRQVPELVPLGLRWVNLGFSSGAYIEDCTMRPPPSVRKIRRAVAKFDPRVRLYNYTADEISECPGLTDRLKTYARRLHRAGVDQLVTMFPRRDLLDDGTGRPAVDIWVLLPKQARNLPPRLRKAVRSERSELWSYQALVQGGNTPSWEIDFPAANFRMLPGFLNAATGYSGVLYWAVNYWKPNPWRDVVFAEPCCYPGEGSLIYPGDPAGIRGPIPTLRLAWIREGIEDYGYVALLRRLGDSGVRGLLEPAAGGWRDWTQDPGVIASVRERLADRIEALSGG